MADFTALKTAIQNAIKQNGNEEITGAILQEVMLAVVSTLGDSAINDLVAALNTEVTNRQNADGTLQSNINAEQSARQLADSTLQSGINNERDLRIAADNALQNAINAINTKLAEGYVYVGIATTSTNPSTPSGKVFYIAVAAGTYTNFHDSGSAALVLTQGINILKYNGTAWSVEQVWGVDDEPTAGSDNLVKSGGVFNDIMTNGSAFDLSAYNNGTTYADLNAALTALNALPAAYKKGGMSIKYVQSSDNKYVQFRLMAQSFTTNTTQWQGIDEVPASNSKNLVYSGGIYGVSYGMSVGYVIPPVEVAITINTTTGAVNMTFPERSTVYCGRYGYRLEESQTINSNDALYDPKYLIFRKDTHQFSFIPIGGNGRDFTADDIIIGKMCRYNEHRQFLNITNVSVNGIKQNFPKIPSTISLNAVSTQKMAYIVSNIGVVFNENINISSSFPFYAIKDIQVVSSSSPNNFYRNGVLKELYITYFRKKSTINSSTIIQIGEKIGTEVGVNKNIFVSCVIESGDNPVGLNTYRLSGNNTVIDVTIDFDQIAGTTSYSFTTECPLYVPRLITQTNQINRSTNELNVVFLGDSVTEFGNYPELVGQKLKANVFKAGFSGSRLAERPTSGTADDVYASAMNELAVYKIAQAVEANNFSAMSAAIQTLKDDYSDDDTVAFNVLTSINWQDIDYVIIFAGTNDFTSSDNPLGENNSTDNITICGAMNTIVDSLLTAYPNLNIMFVTPTHRLWHYPENDDSDIRPNALGLYLYQYADAIVSCANSNHLPALNMYKEGGFNIQNHQYYFGNDGVHPNSLGYEHIASKIAAFIKSQYI